MKIEFTQDYRGKLTREQYYQAGAIVEFDEPVAAQLIAEGRAKTLPTAPVNDSGKGKVGGSKGKVGGNKG